MMTNGGITLYHQTTDDAQRQEVYTRSYFPKCSVYMKVSVEKRHSRNGPWRERETILRIPTKDKLDLAVGDRIVLGECAQESPPDSSLMVCGYADNRRGTGALWHYRVVCR